MRAADNPMRPGAWVMVILTAVAPMIWGSTYLVTTEFLPPDIPFTAAMIRTIPAGLVLLLFKWTPIDRAFWGRLLALSALNIGLFQALLFVAAYRLPGGVAAVLGSIQPLVVLFLAWMIDQHQPRARTILAALVAVAGMALLFAGPGLRWDAIGILAAILGTLSMATGTFLAKRWSPGVPLLPFAGWQLLLGGLMLAPVAWLLDARPGPLQPEHYAAFLYLSLFGALIGYLLWFAGIRRLPPAMVSALGLLSPLTAVFLGWVFLGQALGGAQLAGVAIVLISVITIQLQHQKHENTSRKTA